MEKFVTLRLPEIDAGQIVDGLTQRMNTWKTTQKYLETGQCELGDFIEECSNAHEAKSIAEYYTKIIDLINKQLENQK